MAIAIFKPIIMTVFGVAMLILIAEYANGQRYCIDKDCKNLVKMLKGKD